MDRLLTLTIPGNNGPIEIEAPSGVPTGGLEGDGGKLLGLGITWLLTAAVILAFFFILYGGANWIMSRGEKEKLESARHTIIFAIFGLVVALLSFFIMNMVGGLLGVNFIQLSL
jgi:uncharacterized membrane protein YdjX (TVP38/TMEM64 family)